MIIKYIHQKNVKMVNMREKIKYKKINPHQISDRSFRKKNKCSLSNKELKKIS